MRHMVTRGIARGSALLGLCLVVGLGGCETVSDIFGDADEERLTGERLSVISLDRQLEPDPDSDLLTVRLPPPYVNEDWPQPGGYPHHAMHHLAADDVLSVAWRVRIGRGTGEEEPVLSTPVVAGGRVYTMDSRSLISAFNASTGARLWTADTLPEEDDEGAFGGGLAVAGGWLFATTGLGHVLALDAETGALQWRQPIGVPVRAAPVVSGGRVFAVSHDNRLWSLDASSGALQWSHAAIEESAGFLGGASPAVDGGIVVAPFSSGELTAHRVENGRAVWTDILGVQGARIGAIATFNDIDGHPVSDRGTVFAIGHGGRMVAIDARSGRRVWERDIAGLDMPWVAGDFVFVITADGELVCMSRERGAILWVRSLPRFEDPDEREDPIFWTGPTLVGDRLIVVGSDGSVLSISPYDGRYLGAYNAGGAVRLMPVVADRTLYILTDDADLIALR